MLREGQQAPDFTLPNQDDQNVTLSELRGQKVVLYFYPKDNTPGCTKESIAFSEQAQTFKKDNVVIFGISKDSTASHRKFIEKQNLKVDLLSDTEGKVIEAYGVWREKFNYGKTFLGIVRSTFLINEQGIIEKVWDKVKVNGHVEDVACSL